ncbi:hypothetical protein [Loigolactobacillus rennini]|uniref:Uncharacterized protein n=1 Tax=Loigolactobacillus rennini DSM 20253 TaxID=1423796 RepID=A0A0R2CNM1_9LACO|nr:hypothetical protein [Loigolactobacillus rennini]KRM92869.1 hypothetical protein FC24_GL000885 [Loigolactobacillus rennini DSM 20253]
MTQYTPIDFGAPQWDQKINENLKQIFSGGVSDSGWVACASLLNGAQDYYALTDKASDTTIKRRVLDFHKFKIVMITGALGAKYQDVKPGDVPLIKLPSGYPVSHNYVFGLINAGTKDGYNRWDITMDGQEISLKACHLAEDIKDTGYIIWLPVNIWYVSN